MKFLIDENLPVRLKEKLTESGYDAIDIREIKIGAEDREIIDIASKQGCVLISANYKHFANILLFPPSTYPGVIVVKMPKCSIDEVINRIIKTIKYLKEDDIKHSMIIIEPHRIRKRK